MTYRTISILPFHEEPLGQQDRPKSETIFLEGNKHLREDTSELLIELIAFCGYVVLCNQKNVIGMKFIVVGLDF